MTARWDKTALKRELVGVLTATLADLERAQRTTQEGATHEEAKPENDKDTRAIEQSYLARGQAQRVIELRAALAEISALPVRAFGSESPVALGAVVEVEEDERAHVYFVVPHGAGSTLAGGSVQVVTSKSPLGRALIGKYVGETVEVRLGDRVRELTLVALE